MSLPSPNSFGPEIDDYQTSLPGPDIGCESGERPGVAAFRDLVLREVGGGAGNISRPCDLGAASDHHAGRAWDWMVRADSPADVAKVEKVLDWLFATDQWGNKDAIFRRLGLTYLIWNHNVWSTKTGKAWAPYRGANPHTDHVHFSFSVPGSLMETSFWGPQAPAPPLDKPQGGAKTVSGSSSGNALAFAIGALGGFLGLRRGLVRRRKRR